MILMPFATPDGKMNSWRVAHDAFLAVYYSAPIKTGRLTFSQVQTRYN